MHSRNGANLKKYRFYPNPYDNDGKQTINGKIIDLYIKESDETIKAAIENGDAENINDNNAAPQNLTFDINGKLKAFNEKYSKTPTEDLTQDQILWIDNLLKKYLNKNVQNDEMWKTLDTPSQLIRNPDMFNAWMAIDKMFDILWKKPGITEKMLTEKGYSKKSGFDALEYPNSYDKDGNEQDQGQIVKFYRRESERAIAKAIQQGKVEKTIDEEQIQRNFDYFKDFLTFNYKGDAYSEQKLQVVRQDPNGVNFLKDGETGKTYAYQLKWIKNIGDGMKKENKFLITANMSLSVKIDKIEKSNENDEDCKYYIIKFTKVTLNDFMNSNNKNYEINTSLDEDALNLLSRQSKCSILIPEDIRIMKNNENAHVVIKSPQNTDIPNYKDTITSFDANSKNKNWLIVFLGKLLQKLLDNKISALSSEKPPTHENELKFLNKIKFHYVFNKQFKNKMQIIKKRWYEKEYGIRNLSNEDKKFYEKFLDNLEKIKEKHYSPTSTAAIANFIDLFEHFNIYSHFVITMKDIDKMLTTLNDDKKITNNLKHYYNIEITMEKIEGFKDKIKTQNVTLF